MNEHSFGIEQRLRLQECEFLLGRRIGPLGDVQGECFVERIGDEEPGSVLIVTALGISGCLSDTDTIRPLAMPT